MANSTPEFAHLGEQVVNCFQISNFVLWQTAGVPRDLLKMEL